MTDREETGPELPPLSGLREAPAPDAGRVFRRVRRRRATRAAAAGAVGLAAAVALGFLAWPDAPPDGSGRWRGVGEEPPRVSLGAVAEGPGGPRPLAGGAVGPAERVVFSVTVDRPAEVAIVEVRGGATTPVWPPSGAWEVRGEAFVGGEAPLAWRPDGGAGPARYEVRACPVGGGSPCGQAALELRWEAETP